MNAVCSNEREKSLSVADVRRCLSKPSENVISCARRDRLREHCSKILLLGVTLVLASLIWRVSADIRLTTLVLEVDLRLVERRLEQVVRPN